MQPKNGSTEREPVYAGIISAGSGSVSSTKIKKELEGKKKKKYKKIEYLNKAPVGTSHKANLSQYQRKYKFTPAAVINSSRASKLSKPPLGTINSTMTSSGVGSYKYNKSHLDGLEISRGYSSGASYKSVESQNDQQTPDPNIRSFITDAKKNVAGKLSATLPKTSATKNISSTSNYKSQLHQKKQSSGQRIKVYSNSSRDQKKLNYGSSISYPDSISKYESPGLRTSKYARIPKSIPKSNPGMTSNTDGSAVQVRTFEWSTSPFRTDESSNRSAQRSTYLSYKKSTGSGINSSLGPRPMSNLE